MLGSWTLVNEKKCSLINYSKTCTLNANFSKYIILLESKANITFKLSRQNWIKILQLNLVKIVLFLGHVVSTYHIWLKLRAKYFFCSMSTVLIFFFKLSLLEVDCICIVCTVWETTACQLAIGEWKFRVASKIHFILAGLARNSCKASRNLKTLATTTGLQL